MYHRAARWGGTRKFLQKQTKETKLCARGEGPSLGKRASVRIPLFSIHNIPGRARCPIAPQGGTGPGNFYRSKRRKQSFVPVRKHLRYLRYLLFNPHFLQFLPSQVGRDVPSRRKMGRDPEIFTEANEGNKALCPWGRTFVR